ncbi:epoxide hydrolase family protein [Microbispora hainanensis]|uniref:Epoxide hydrolase n=1 Tax=Microbispora hainanensis TaxID=568844 RepID=A0ABZ1SMC5_9ACTN|nr:epoxide hydrolase family protein [Microbispora hainanensis]
MSENTQITPPIRPFRIDVPRADLDDLKDRLGRTRWPDEIPETGWEYGVPVAYVKRLAEYWRDGYDWRAHETEINRYPQFVTEIDGQDIHFLHVRSPHEDALPLILTHGWPGSIVEYLKVIEPLTNPEDPAQAFHLVIPSLPGFGFSGPTRERGWNRFRTARAWAELMRRLGYDRYGAVGNDGGSFVSPEVGRVDPEHVVGVHVTQIFSFPSGDPAEMANLTDEERKGLEVLQWFYENKMSFNMVHSQQPQTMSYGIFDSPAGLLGWNAQLFGEDVDDDFILTNTMLYWVTGTATSATRFYYEDAHAEHPKEPTTVPLGLAMFEGDFVSMRTFAERDHRNIVHWRSYDAGGHYAAHLRPDVLSADLRDFYAALR